MKKWMSILVTVVMLCGLLAGCGSSDGKKSDIAAETELIDIAEKSRDNSDNEQNK